MSSGNLPQTPKKVYKSSGNTSSSCCRLCKSVGDTSCWKNLFGKRNRPLLATAEIIYGSPLIQDKTLPHLLCRPCERRLKNFEIFRVAIKESQSSFQRVKRCIEISPSVARTLSKSAKDSANSRRRELCFEARTDRINTPQSSSGKEVDKCRLSLIYLRCVFACVHNLALFNIRAIISLIQRGQMFLFTEWPTKSIFDRQKSPRKCPGTRRKSPRGSPGSGWL